MPHPACHVGHTSVITYNAYYHASALYAYIQQPYATSTIEHVRGSTTFELEPRRLGVSGRDRRGGADVQR